MENNEKKVYNPFETPPSFKIPISSPEVAKNDTTEKVVEKEKAKDSEEVEEPKEEIKKFSKDRPMVRVGLEIYEDLDKKIEIIVAKKGGNIKKKHVVNDLLEFALKNK